jgi:hypothetical protein
MSWLLLVVVVLGITLLHELAHVLVARLFGYRPLAWGPVVLGAFIIFDDTFEPDWPPLYWPLQLVLPWLVTAATLPLAWLLGFEAAGLTWATAGQLAISPMMLILSLLVSALGSLGDLILVLTMPRLATREPDLTLRDMKMHQKFGARPIFTHYGQDALQRRYGESANEVWERAKTLPARRRKNKTRSV